MQWEERSQESILSRVEEAVFHCVLSVFSPRRGLAFLVVYIPDQRVDARSPLFKPEEVVMQDFVLSVCPILVTEKKVLPSLSAVLSLSEPIGGH